MFCEGRKREKKPHNILERNLRSEYTQRDIQKLHPQRGNVHPHCSDRNKSVLRRLFVEVLTSSCSLGFAGKKGVKLDPLANLEVLPNHLDFCGKCNTLIQEHDSQNCTSEPWFRDTEVNNKSSTLFPVDPGNCPVI